MYPNWKFRTRVPEGKVLQWLNFEELYQRHLEEKTKMKDYADRKRQVKTSVKQIGDLILVWREATDKGSPAYEAAVACTAQKGFAYHCKRKQIAPISLTPTAHFKKVLYCYKEETQEWSTSRELREESEMLPKDEMRADANQGPEAEAVQTGT